MQKKRDNSQQFMSTVKLGPKGQIVIPKEVRDMFDLKPGDSLLLLADSSQGIALQRSSIMQKIADAIFAGQGQNVIPGEPEENLQNFATAIREATEELK